VALNIIKGINFYIAKKNLVTTGMALIAREDKAVFRLDNVDCVTRKCDA
jgi:hypothetical protein